MLVMGGAAPKHRQALPQRTCRLGVVNLGTGYNGQTGYAYGDYGLNCYLPGGCGCNGEARKGLYGFNPETGNWVLLAWGIAPFSLECNTGQLLYLTQGLGGFGAGQYAFLTEIWSGSTKITWQLANFEL